MNIRSFANVVFRAVIRHFSGFTARKRLTSEKHMGWNPSEGIFGPSKVIDVSFYADRDLKHIFVGTDTKPRWTLKCRLQPQNVHHYEYGHWDEKPSEYPAYSKGGSFLEAALISNLTDNDLKKIIETWQRTGSIDKILEEHKDLGIHNEEAFSIVREILENTSPFYKSKPRDFSF